MVLMFSSFGNDEIDDTQTASKDLASLGLFLTVSVINFIILSKLNINTLLSYHCPHTVVIKATQHCKLRKSLIALAIVSRHIRSAGAVALNTVSITVHHRDKLGVLFDRLKISPFGPFVGLFLLGFWVFLLIISV